jgi:hypothetical protein
MKPICVSCQRFYRPKKNGFTFVEGMPTMTCARPGKQDAALWKPYKLWVGDLWECEGCQAQIIVGTGAGPISIHHLPNFAEQVKKSGGDQLQVNDC